MNANRVSNEDGVVTKKGKKGNKLKIVLVVIFLTLGVVFFFGWVMPAFANGTDCSAPAGYQMITNRIVTDLNGNSIFILRGFVATGEGIPGGKKITLPPCGSSEASLATINNMFIVLDGKQMFLAAGSVGLDNSVNPTEVPQP